MTQHEELLRNLKDISASDLHIDDLYAAIDAIESQSREIAALKEQEAELCTLHGLAEAECKRLRKDAELWRWAITTGRDHRHNIFKAYDNWDGQDSFEDAAIAAKGGA